MWQHTKGYFLESARVNKLKVIITSALSYDLPQVRETKLTARANVADGNFRLCLHFLLQFTNIRSSVELSIAIFTWFLTYQRALVLD